MGLPPRSSLIDKDGQHIFGFLGCYKPTFDLKSPTERNRIEDIQRAKEGLKEPSNINVYDGPPQPPPPAAQQTQDAGQEPKPIEPEIEIIPPEPKAPSPIRHSHIERPPITMRDRWKALSE